MNLYQIIKHPVLTEKAIDNQQSNCYVFWVDPKATKPQIKAAVEKIYQVTPLAVRTASVSGKKKAFVQLSEGKEISIAKLSE